MVRAEDTVLERVVAIKIISEQIAGFSAPRKRFLREARAAAKIRHDHVVRVYEIGEIPLPFLVMEYIPGKTLQDRLQTVGPLDVAEVVRLGGEIAGGLAAAHGSGLVHRDIKPENILLEDGDLQRAKLTDFGLVRAIDDANQSQSGSTVGTPMYMAPEQASGESIDFRTDLFSLGSVLYTMTSGRPPFRAATTLAVLRRVCEDVPRSIRELIPETPQWLCDIISKLQEKSPSFSRAARPRWNSSGPWNRLFMPSCRGRKREPFMLARRRW